MGESIRARFEVSEWNDTPAGDVEAEARVTRAVVRKTYTSGLIGTSVAIVITTRNDAGAAYTAIELFRGTLGDRAGELSFVHGGIHSGDGDVGFGHVVPGSGTEGLTGASGTIVFGHDSDGGFATISIEL